jgi:hypothetical protein
VGDKKLANNEEKAQAFIDLFFPPMAPAQDETFANTLSRQSWEPIYEARCLSIPESHKGALLGVWVPRYQYEDMKIVT